MIAPFDAEQETFRRTLREFVSREITPQVPAWEQARAVPRELFAKLGELGALGIRLSPDHGGSGLDFRQTAVLVQELVRCGSVGVAVSVLAHAEFATKIIDRAGTEAQKQRFVRGAAEGTLIGALGVTEPGAGSDVGAIRTRAVRDGDHYVVDGAKTFISNANIADFVTTAVRTGGPGHRGLSVLVIPSDTPGLSRGRRLEKVGTHASDTGELVFEGCRVPVANLLGEENRGFKLIMEGFEGERLVLALICCTQMRLMWEAARAYGHERSAFGQPLLGFQVWRHRLADALTTIEAAEALTYRAIELSVAGEPCNRMASTAKLFASEAAIGVGHSCAQIFGGNRYMEEYPIARLQRDSLAFTIGAGTSEIMREIIARTAGLEPEAQ